MLKSGPSIPLIQHRKSKFQRLAEDTLEEVGKEANDASTKLDVLKTICSDRRRRRIRAIPWKGESCFGGFAYCASFHPEHPDGRGQYSQSIAATLSSNVS